MYGVKDNFARTKSYSAPELTEAMKAKRNSIWIVGILATIFFGGSWALITFTPVAVWAPIVLIVGISGFVVFMVFIGIDMIAAGCEWVGDQFSIWNKAKEYGVRDE